MTTILIQGMGGLGDCLHQRGVVRQYLAKRHDVWLETPWPALYHDLVPLGLKLLPKVTSLRTQSKNARRERAAYVRSRPARRPSHVRVHYSPQAVLEEGSVLGAMCKAAGVAVEAADFRLPIPPAWREKAWKALGDRAPTKPLMIVRPLVERTEWGGCAARNPDADAYAALVGRLRDLFCVISVADLVPGVEWSVGPSLGADIEFHAGELDVEALAGLTAEAALVVSAPGFATIMAQAVGTASVTVFGGYEDGRSFSAGARFAPHLAIQPVEPCPCFRHDCPCDKRIHMPAALKALEAFVAEHRLHLREAPAPPVFGGRPTGRPTQPVPPADCDLSGLPTRYANPGELERLIALVASVNPRTMIEIGCNNGRTAKAVLRNVPGLERYVGIDVPPDYAFAKAVQRKEAPERPGELALDDPRFRLVLARRGTFDLTAEDLPACDVVFIDGDHGAEAVRNDHALARQLVRPGGLIIHHDDHDLGTVDVRQVLDELSTPDRPIVHVAGTWLAFERVPSAARKAA